MSVAISNVYRDITLDLYNTDSSPVTVKAVQGDTASRFLNVLLTNAGDLYSPDDEAHAQLFVIKPDGYVVYNNGTIESDTITFELTNQILAVPGKCTCQVLLWDRDYEQVVRSATPLFIDIAEKLDDESAIASTNEYGVLEDLLQEIEEGGYITDNNFTDAYKTKLDMVDANAEPNQNAFSNVSVDGTTMSATEETDTLSMTLGDGLVANVNGNANVFELALDLPDASELERGLLTPEDYIRFSTVQSGDHTIKEVTATEVTIELSDSTEVSLARSDGNGSLIAAYTDKVIELETLMAKQIEVKDNQLHLTTYFNEGNNNGDGGVLAYNEYLNKLFGDWMAENLDDSAIALIDKSLMIGDACADAKATGDMIRALTARVEALENR